MRETLQVNIIDEGVAQITALLNEDREKLFKAYEDNIMDAEAGKKVSFKINLSLTLSPVGSDTSVKANISCSTKHSNESDPSLISDQMTMELT